MKSLKVRRIPGKAFASNLVLRRFVKIDRRWLILLVTGCVIVNMLMWWEVGLPKLADTFVESARGNWVGDGALIGQHLRNNLDESQGQIVLIFPGNHDAQEISKRVFPYVITARVVLYSHPIQLRPEEFDPRVDDDLLQRWMIKCGDDQKNACSLHRMNGKYNSMMLFKSVGVETYIAMKVDRPEFSLPNNNVIVIVPESWVDR